MVILYILLAILAFGLLIFLHELGHYLSARAFGVAIKEFSIGMGPRIFGYTSKKTGIEYKLCLLPLGGYVSMVGEDEESDDPNALGKKPAWQRLIIMAAGGVTNLLLGFLLVLLTVSLISNHLATTTVDSFPTRKDGSAVPSYQAGLREGDIIRRVDGRRVRIGAELDYEIMRRGIEPLTLEVERDGKLMYIEVDFITSVDEASNQTLGIRDFNLTVEDGSLLDVLRHTFFRSVMTVRMVWESLYDLITGRFGIEAVSGPVGVAGVMVETAKTGIVNFIYLVAVISLNLGVVNLFPLPALDGGRILFLGISAIIRRPIPEKVEGIIHFAGLLLLLGLMLFVTGKDILQLIF